MENQDKVFNFFRFEDLRIYHKSLDYVKWVYNMTESFPQSKSESLRESFIKAATNIAINIAEGSGRNKSQFVYYLKMAKSSIRECVVLSSIAHQENFISIDKEEESRGFLIEISKMVGALIASLQRSRRPENEEDEADDLPVHEDPNSY